MMYLPPPQPILNKDIRISGNVEIHPTASLGPGVILQAAPNGRIVIGADVCIGMGVIINACQGAIEIGNGAILGSGVLIMGKCKIGNNSCVGTSTTIFQNDVAAMTVIEPGSIIGDSSRQVVLDSPNGNKASSQPQSAKAHVNGTQPAVKNQAVNTPESTVAKDSTSTPSVDTAVESPVTQSKVPVVGQVYINELLVTLFPYKKSSNSNILD